MTSAQLRAWLEGQGCTWPSGVNAGQIDYRKARALTGYSAAHLKNMLRGDRPVSGRIEAMAGVPFALRTRRRVSRQPKPAPSTP